MNSKYILFAMSVLFMIFSCTLAYSEPDPTPSFTDKEILFRAIQNIQARIK